MATKSQIEITFTRDALDTENVSFIRTDDLTLSGIPILSTFVSGARTSNGQLPINTPTATPGEAEAAAYEKYFNIDHNVAGLMTISRLVNVVTIDININWELSGFTSTAGATDVLNTRVGLEFVLLQADLQIHPSEPCDKVDVDILTNIQADGYTYSLNDVALIPVATNPFTVPIFRTVPTNIYLHKAGSAIINVVELEFNEPHLYFRKIFTNILTIGIQSSPLVGATVSINVNYGSQLSQRPFTEVVTYSLDNVSFQSSNTFTGQTDGDYTIYVKDSIGCTVQKDYTVDTGASGRDAFIKVSNINSVTFSKDEIWDGLQDGIHKNQDNVLALTDFKKTLFDEKLIYRNEDEIRIQFKSNYRDNDIIIEHCDGTDTGTGIVVEQMSANLNLFESLDAIMYRVRQDVTGLYFTSGNVYDENDIIISEQSPYELNGNLPDSAKIGNLIEIVGHGIHPIIDIVYDRDKDKNVMVFDFNFSSSVDIDVVMRSYYDLLPFEVYEFNVDFSAISIHAGLPREVRIRIQSTDDLYDEVNHYSEFISILETYEDGFSKYAAINYSNNNNRDIFYLYGITHFIRAEILEVNALIDDDSEVIKGDLTTYLSESTVHEGITISFSEVTYRVMLKIVLALSSENLFINGLGYVKRDNVKVDPVPNTNLYSIVCELLSTNQNFNTFINSDTGNREDFNTNYVPKLVTSGSGSYIKI